VRGGVSSGGKIPGARRAAKAAGPAGWRDRGWGAGEHVDPSLALSACIALRPAAAGCGSGSGGGDGGGDGTRGAHAFSLGFAPFREEERENRKIRNVHVIDWTRYTPCPI